MTFKTVCDILSHGSNLGVAQMVARYLGVVEAAGSNPVTQTKYSRRASALRLYLICMLEFESNITRLPGYEGVPDAYSVGGSRLGRWFKSSHSDHIEFL